MTAYLVRRLGQGVLVIAIVTVIVFALLNALPGGPARAILGAKANARAIAEFKHDNYLDRSLPIQYGAWIGRLIKGNFGRSYNQNEDVSTLIAQRLPKTLILTSLSLLVSLVIGLPLGMLQAVKRKRAVDHAISVLSLAAYSAPIFLVGIIGIWLFAVKWHILPAQAPQGTSAIGILSHPSGLVLPVLALGVGSTAVFSRYMRSSTVENLVQDYVRLARAKGLSSTRVLLGHVCRNALGPIATQLGLFLPVIMAGTVITESVFNYPGMGLLFWNAAVARDYPTELGVVLVVAVATVFGSLCADIAYAVLDPRIRYARNRV